MKRNLVIIVAAVLAVAAFCTILWATRPESQPQTGTQPIVSTPTTAPETTVSTAPTQPSLPESTAHTHSFLYEVTSEPTCMDGGHATNTCQVCGEASYVELAPLGHSFTNYVSNGDALCDQDGTMTAKCDRCEETETITEEGSALVHQYVSQTFAPTCTKAGYTVHTCSVCNHSYQDGNVAASGHSFLVNTIPATCTLPGYTRYTCTTCALTTKENQVAALGHAYGDWTVQSELTCVQDGVRQRACATCADVETEVTAAPGHTFGDWIAEDVEIAENAFVQNRTCVACNTLQTRLDGSAMEATQVEEVVQLLTQMPEISHVELMKADGTTNFTMADVKRLVEAAPEAYFNYVFNLFGFKVNASAEKVQFIDLPIGNAGETEIRAALDILNHCTYFKLDNCGIDNEIVASIRDDYPETKVVWRIFVGHKSWLTDTDTLRALYLITNYNCEPLKYLTEVKYMDLGHNESMVDLSFISYMPDLEIAILSGSPIKDLTPLANCKKLVFLELAWCGHLKDISPLAGCDSLLYLNVGHTQVSDFSALYGMNLQMLSYVNSGNRVGFTEADWAYLQTKFPTCWITYAPLYDYNATPYGVGWRYKENWGGYTEIYRKVRDVFNYDYIDSLIQGGAT